MFGFGLLGDLVLHDLKLLSEQWVSNGYSAKSLLGTVSVKREGMRGGRESLEGGNLCTLMANSHCCTAETNTTL